ncbi:MAG: cation diffusion facilitator family transporter [Candidatus Aminicenantes bacterium]|nr:cation diffusion facilitator family transporter [Candidatus Aminicenantes bacterium]
MSARVSPASTAPSEAAREKNSAAAGSVIAAVFLTGLKIAVGLATGSLGILAEAAHSALDLVAAVMTLIAVRVAGKPADRTHTYGHGKVENLSALLETALLLVTCVWIVFEAGRRLFFHEVEVEASIWAFLVMAVSIVIDISRSRVLSRAAKKHHSQALEADALHFSTDVWSSSVVILGLVLVWLADIVKLPWLVKADAVAALGVSAIVVVVSLRLGKKTITDLLDGVPADLREEVVRAAHVPGVIEVDRVRIRRSGPEIFVDAVLFVSRHAAFAHAHEISNEAQAAIRRALDLPLADVIIHVAPSREETRDLIEDIREIAARMDMAAHEIRLYEAGGRPALDLHLEIRDAATVAAAHARATAFEDAVHTAVPGLDRIFTHLEPVNGEASLVPIAADEESAIRRRIAELSVAMGVVCEPHHIVVEETAGEICVSFHCSLAPETPLGEAHKFSERFETELRHHLPRIGRVLIHIEPPGPVEREPI